MSTRLPNQMQAQRAEATARPAGVLLQRKCACEKHTVGGSQCADCEKRSVRPQRSALNQTEAAAVPEIVHDVLRSPGQPLDRQTLAFMESRFQHDFSRVPVRAVARRSAPGELHVGAANDHFEQEADHAAARVMQSSAQGAAGEGGAAHLDFSRVRVHTDARAAESARAVNALAYAVGNDVVFGAGQYAPGTSAGRRLLAHELAHTLQQSDSSRALSIQRMATCPPRMEAHDPVPPGWKPYYGNSCWFHCCYHGILEDRRPTREDPQNECFYDENGVLVTASHPHAGCAGTPNFYDSESETAGHIFLDPGGIWQRGWGAFWSSRGHDITSAGCLSRCVNMSGLAKFHCYRQCMQGR
ncbi:MAG: DUF4157 domain-containing protein [Pyrinomonadaceae bacterium]